MHTGHQPYLAYVEQTPVGYAGWRRRQPHRRTGPTRWHSRDRSVFMGTLPHSRIGRGTVSTHGSCKTFRPTTGPRSNASGSFMHRKQPIGRGMTKPAAAEFGQLSLSQRGRGRSRTFDGLGTRPGRCWPCFGIPLIESVLAPLLGAVVRDPHPQPARRRRFCWPRPKHDATLLVRRSNEAGQKRAA